MLPFQSYYCTSATGDEFLQGVMTHQFPGGGSTSSSRSTVEEAKAVAACKSHSEAERRRRERINGRLATLRTCLPNTAKTDKASLLANVVQHVKELKKVAADMALQDRDGCSSSREWLFPGETDELTLGYYEESGEEQNLIRVSLCCDDRHDLLSDLTRALRSVHVRVLKAEMATVGGRTKNVFVINGGDCGGGGGGGGDNNVLGKLRRALKAVLNKPAMSAALGQVGSGNKRPRLSLCQQPIANN